MFRRFFSNRYGNDELNMTVMAIALLVGIISAFTKGMTFLIFALTQALLLCFWFLRFFSKNRFARNSENQKFLRLCLYFRDFFKGIKPFFKRMTDFEHKYFKCPRCKSRLRVPRGRGIITITCPRCRHRFDKKS